jgi:hypothetical protein
VHIGKHSYQQEEVPQLFPDMGWVFFVNGFQKLVGFLDKIPPQA